MKATGRTILTVLLACTGSTGAAQPQGSPAPGVETRVPGKTKGGIDLKNITPADIATMPDDQFNDLIAEGVKIPTGKYTNDAEGNRVPEYWMTKAGGNLASESIRNARKGAALMEKKLHGEG